MNDRFVVCRIDSAGTKWYYTGCHYKPWMTGYINAIEFGTKETADKMAAQMAGKTVEAIMDGSGEIVVISDSRASIFLR